MSWAARRRAIYILCIAIFFLIVLVGPVAYWYLNIPTTCTDGIRNQDETAIDRGGQCPFLDEAVLQPYATMWARSFQVRDGLYNAVAYVENPNKGVGVRKAQYRFGLYDARNILIAERVGTTSILPGGVTPVVEARIDTGNRLVSRTYFEFTETLLWERVVNPALAISINNKDASSVTESPRISATAENTSVAPIDDPTFVAVVFDAAGNAFATSVTRLNRMAAGSISDIVFSWPDPFPREVGKIDIIPLVVLVPFGKSVQ